MSSSKSMGRRRRAIDDAAVLAAAGRVTDRDRYLIRVVGTYRVLTTPQLAALGFSNLTTAQHRLSVLVGLELLRRFRPRRALGSAPWHYILGPLGAALLEIEDGNDAEKWHQKVRTDRQLALQRSQRLGHIIGTNEFFISLLRKSRTGTGCLREWIPENEAPFYYQHAYNAVRPDGIGVWVQDNREIAFLLEYDNGTENMTRLTRKLADYREFTERFYEDPPPVLFCFTSARRELNARTAFTKSADSARIRLATATFHTGISAADGIWQPLQRTGPRLRLIELSSAFPYWQPQGYGQEINP